MNKGNNKERAAPSDEVVEIVLDLALPKRKIKIETDLLPQLRNEIIHIQVFFKIIFVWGPEDMPGVDR